MDELQTISKNNSSMYIQMVVVGVVGLLLMILASWIMKTIDSMLPWDMQGLTNLFRVIIIFVIVGAVVSAYANGRKGMYQLDSHSLHIKTGGMGKKRQRIFDYKNVTSFDMKQSYLGSVFHYGDIVVNMDHLENNEKVILKNINEPKLVLEKMHAASIRAKS